jgi:DNA-binding transcriptional ArsR family regulator
MNCDAAEQEELSVKRQISPNACADKLRILSDPTRLSVLELLLAGSLHVGEINDKLRIEQSLLSHHLKVLREAGLVKAARDGKSVRYSLSERTETSHSRKAINLGCCILAFGEDDSA